MTNLTEKINVKIKYIPDNFRGSLDICEIIDTNNITYKIKENYNYELDSYTEWDIFYNNILIGEKRLSENRHINGNFDVTCQEIELNRELVNVIDITDYSQH